jgi:peptidoglycan/LPS O-acetylase OafA/YrhL
MADNVAATGIRYRPDIDGLRAVAIVPVVLYHAGFAPFGGGFVGVDVFFVISGYLIASFILGQIDSGKFTLRAFYIRRIRRIFPALFLMMAGCAAIGWSLLTPHDYRRLGESIVATVLFSSNILFWLRSGYFATPIEQRPLLHTWSLGVEEQFYLVFPIFLILLCRFFPRRLIAITLTLCLLSFWLNLLTVKAHPSFAFFLAPTRIWELFVGVLLAAGAVAPPRSNEWSEAAGLAGAALIGGAVFGISGKMPFPGFAALAPTLGAAAIIWAGTGGKGRVTRLLSRPAPVMVGKISYSLYLWHLPLLAFAAYVVVDKPSPILRLALIALSIVLAVLSWRYVEQPVRQGSWIFGQSRAVFGAAAAAIVLLGGFGFAAHVAGGFPGRIGEPGRGIVAAEGDFNPDRESCLGLDETAIVRRPLCKFGVRDAEPEYALWGDSHAESLRAAFDGAANRARRAGIFLGNPGCVAELGIDRDGSGCDRLNAAIAARLLSLPSIHTVILAGRWGLWAEGQPYRGETGNSVSLADASGTPMDNHAALTAGLEGAVAKLTSAGKRVWLIGPIPEIGYNVPRTLYFDLRGIPRSIKLRPTIDDFNNRENFVLKLFPEIAEKYHVSVIWPHQFLCDEQFCEVQKDGRPLYIDEGHLTRSAAILMSAMFDPIFAEPGQSDRPIAKAP